VTLPSLLTEDLVGERTQPHSLQVAGIDAFVSPQANGNGTSERWKPVNAPLVSELARRSQVRVAGNEMFLEIEEQVAKRQADDGVVRLSELLAEQEQEKAKNGDATTASTAPETKPAADAPTPHIDEALKVLADLVLLNS